MVHGGALTGDDDSTDDSSFLRVVCHELGTPVASVRALARALGHRSSLSPDQRDEAVRLIEDHAQHMAAMANAQEHGRAPIALRADRRRHALRIDAGRGADVFHNMGLQFEARPDEPDPIFAHKLQEVLGGAWGEITVAMQYLFQGWNCRMPGKYKDLPRRYAMTDDPGVKNLLQFLIARDTGHQNQWLAAIEELEDDGLETTPVPSDFPRSEEHQEASYQYWPMSSGGGMGASSGDTTRGRWTHGPTPDGNGEFTVVEDPQPMTSEPPPPTSTPELYVTGRGGRTQQGINKLTD